MNIDGLENIKIGDLKEIFKVNDLSIKEAMPHMHKFRDDNGLTDKQALNAFSVAKRIFDA